MSIGRIEWGHGQSEHGCKLGADIALFERLECLVYEGSDVPRRVVPIGQEHAMPVGQVAALKSAGYPEKRSR